VFLSVFNKRKKYIGVKSFTYFLPAPPTRKSGYQEKEFDHLFSHIMSLGFDVIDVKLQSLNTENSQGVWILCLLGAKTKEAFETPIQVDYQEISKNVSHHSNIKMDPLIEHDC